MMKRSSVLILRRGISRLCKNGASALTRNHSEGSSEPHRVLRAFVSSPRVPVQGPSSGITGAGRQPASGGAGEHHHHTRHALPAQPEVLLVACVHKGQHLQLHNRLVLFVGFFFTTMWCSTAKEVEDIVRAEGATPATVGVIDGELRVGLSSQELEQLARCEGSLKVSRRDLPYVISKVRHVAQVQFCLITSPSRSQPRASV